MPAPPFRAPTTEPQTYVGICRCRATKFRLTLPELTGTVKCDCSFCTTHDIYSWLGSSDQLAVERAGPQTTYRHGTQTLDIQFCSICGNMLYVMMPDSNQCAVNLRVLQDVDLWSLRVDKTFPGSTVDPPYVPAPYHGPPFADAKDGTNIYEGGCHCGAVTIALRSQPLEDVTINECNCAYCWKAGRVHVYPAAEDVHLGGAEHLALYETNPGGAGAFCQTCGTPMLDVDYVPPKDAHGTLIKDPTETLGHAWTACAVNIRVLRGVDPATLPNIHRYNGRSRDPQFVAD